MAQYRRVARRGGGDISGFVVTRSDVTLPKPAAVEPEVTIARELPSDLDSLKKDELVALADTRGVDASGTKAEIAERLRG